MNVKSLLLAGVLTLSGLSIANAKSYSFTLDQSAKAGTVTLTPGEYKLKLDGTNAVFTNIRTDQKFTTPVTVGNSDKKNESTAVESNTQDGMEHIQSIELGGSRETLQFRD